jgi:hypothetical protein
MERFSWSGVSDFPASYPSRIIMIPYEEGTAIVAATVCAQTEATESYLTERVAEAVAGSHRIEQQFHYEKLALFTLNTEGMGFMFALSEFVRIMRRVLYKTTDRCHLILGATTAATVEEAANHVSELTSLMDRERVALGYPPRSASSRFNQRDFAAAVQLPIVDPDVVPADTAYRLTCTAPAELGGEE